MAILTNSGRVAMAQSVKAQPIHLAWGSGSAAWDTTPVPESITATALLAGIDITASDPLARIAQLGLSVCAEPETTLNEDTP